MKLFGQLATLLGMLLSGFYSYVTNYSFESVIAFLSFLAMFSTTFFLGNNSKMNQKTGKNSNAYQASGDINIKGSNPNTDKPGNS